jgi:hypothetical protein
VPTCPARSNKQLLPLLFHSSSGLLWQQAMIHSRLVCMQHNPNSNCESLALVILLPTQPEANEFDLSFWFRKNKWDLHQPSADTFHCVSVFSCLVVWHSPCILTLDASVCDALVCGLFSVLTFMCHVITNSVSQQPPTPAVLECASLPTSLAMVQQLAEQLHSRQCWLLCSRHSSRDEKALVCTG